ncbi:MAG: hypothetical protein CMC14_05540 [Flavobacteriaceae bacterium]|nr:hypothetical protein [Flavobacteriaceae bacterium]
MWLLSAKKLVKKVAAWCIQHWRWLVLLVAFLITYILGGRKNRSLLLQAKLAKDQYKSEVNIIETAHKKEVEGRKKAHKKHNSAIESVARTREKKSEALSGKKLKLVNEMTDDDVQAWLDNNNFEEK